MPNPHPRPWHAGSLFGPGPRRPLDREQRVRWIWRIEVERKNRRLSALQADVGRELVSFLGNDGRCDPSHETLANRSGASPRTVRRALAALAHLGLVRWVRRLIRVPWPSGGRGATRVEQDTNSYEVLLPDPTANRPVTPVNCGGQSGREVRIRKIQKTQLAFLPPASPGEIEAAQAALARRQAVIQGRLLKNGRIMAYTNGLGS